MLQKLSCPGCSAPVEPPLAPGRALTCAFCGASLLWEDRGPPPGVAGAPGGGALGCASWIAPDPSLHGPLRRRVAALGFEPGGAVDVSAARWVPARRGDVLVVAVSVASGPPFDEAASRPHLGTGWATFSRRFRAGRGQLEPLLVEPLRRVIVVYGEDDPALRQAIDELRFTVGGRRVSMVVNGPFDHLRGRIAQLGCAPATLTGRNFRGWSPRSDDELLVIALTTTGGAPFTEDAWAEYLGSPWPALVAELGDGAGQREHRTPGGRRVVIVYGAAQTGLAEAIRRLRL